MPSVEILAPAGNGECFRAAVNAGADAIYIGLKEFSARSSAENFSVDEIEKYIRYAKFFGIKVYVAVNTLVKGRELPLFFETVGKAYALGADAFILQDMFLGKTLKKFYPDIVLHLSTQAGVCNEYGAKLAAEYGFSRVILARETTADDVKKISKIIETESFVQGALCTSFSGHCYMSSFAGGYSGNRGKCKQPCRKKYTDSVTGECGYKLSLSDLCLKDEVNKLIDCGVSSFKIEGRMRSPEYVYAAVSVYKDILEGRKPENLKELRVAFNRGNYTKGYFCDDMRNVISSKIQGNIGDFIGKIFEIDKGVAKVKTVNEFGTGDGFKVLSQGLEKCGGTFYSYSRGVLCVRLDGVASVGDEVNITKHSTFNKTVLSAQRKEKISVNISIKCNERAKAILKCRDKSIEIYSDEVFSQAVNNPLSRQELIGNFLKTDNYPILPDIAVDELDDVFAPKSVLNAFRRKCYSSIFNLFSVDSKKDIRPVFLPSENSIPSDVKDSKIVVIISDFLLFAQDENHIFVYRPKSYKDLSEAKKFEGTGAYLYLPPFASSSDISLFEEYVVCFDGVYAEGYYGIEFARRHGVKLICGTGFNIYNSIDVSCVKEIGDQTKFVYSKELSSSEISHLPEGYVFRCGDIQVMDLIYCPFSRQCSKCKVGDTYTLHDGSRSFTVRRYAASQCRFEVYNPYPLVFLPSSNDFSGSVFDFTLTNAISASAILKDPSCAKNIYDTYTRGNLNGGVK